MPAFERGQWPIYISFAFGPKSSFLPFYKIVHFREDSCSFTRNKPVTKECRKEADFIPSSEQGTWKKLRNS